MLEFKTLIFYFFAGMLLLASCGVIFSRNPVYSALSLIAAFVSAAGVWMLLYAEFLAIILVLVYVGAVMVLFLFVLMMLDISVQRDRLGWYVPAAVLVAAALVGEIIVVLSDEAFTGASRFVTAAEVDNTRALGGVLYTEYVYPFELAAIILLVAIIAAVALTLRQRKDSKHIEPALQSLAVANQRLRLVKLSSEAAPLSPSEAAAEAPTTDK